MNKTIYTINFHCGEYDDYNSFSIGYVDTYEEAQLIQEALENREEEYVKQIADDYNEEIKNRCGYTFEELMNPNFEWGIDFFAIPKMNI